MSRTLTAVSLVFCVSRCVASVWKEEKQRKNIMSLLSPEKKTCEILKATLSMVQYFVYCSSVYWLRQEEREVKEGKERRTIVFFLSSENLGNIQGYFFNGAIHILCTARACVACTRKKER